MISPLKLREIIQRITRNIREMVGYNNENETEYIQEGVEGVEDENNDDLIFRECVRLKTMMITLNDIPMSAETRMFRIDLIIQIFSILRNDSVLRFLYAYKREFVQTIINKMNQFRNTDVSEWTSEQQTKFSTLKSLFDEISPMVREMTEITEIQA